MSGAYAATADRSHARASVPSCPSKISVHGRPGEAVPALGSAADIECLAGDGVDGGPRAQERRHEIVDEQPVGEMRSHETGAAGDQHAFAHGTGLSKVSSSGSVRRGDHSRPRKRTTLVAHSWLSADVAPPTDGFPFAAVRDESSTPRSAASSRRRTRRTRGCRAAGALNALDEGVLSLARRRPPRRSRDLVPARST